MCGRLNQFAALPSLAIAGKVLKLFPRRADTREDQRSERVVRYNLCPTDYADALTFHEDGLEARRIRFGLIPHWARGGKAEVWRKFMMTFNARCETVFELASYRQPVRQRRCLVPVRGWHEWPDRQTPFYIHRADDQPLFLAGIWDTWESRDPADAASGAVVTSMSVITTPPGPYMAKFHDRGPLVLEGERALAWLRPDTPEEVLRAWMQPYDSPQLEAYRVGTAVNRATFKDASVCAPIAAPVPQGDGPWGDENGATPPLKLF